MLLLALDTAGPVVSVAVHDGSSVLGSGTGEGAMAHGELLAPAITRALEQAGAAAADLTDVAVGVGPGPFTGLRVGVVTALSLAQTLGLRAHGVCSLDAVEAGRAGEYLVAIDARRREVYWARYVDDRRVDGPHVDRPAELASRHPGVPVVGRGALLHADHLVAADGSQSRLDPSAELLAEAVVERRVEILPLEPLYLRRPDATPAW